MIDGHIHYIEYMGADRLNQIVEEYHYDGIALQCIPDSAGRESLEDAFRYREQCFVPVYIFGGIRRELYRLPEDELKAALVWALIGIVISILFTVIFGATFAGIMNSAAYY